MEAIRANRVTKSFVCGTCVYCKHDIMAYDVMTYCGLTTIRVDKAQPFCDKFLSTQLLENWLDFHFSVLARTGKTTAFQ